MLLLLLLSLLLFYRCCHPVVALADASVAAGINFVASVVTVAIGSVEVVAVAVAATDAVIALLLQWLL